MEIEYKYNTNLFNIYYDLVKDEFHIKKHIRNPITILIYYTKYIAENEKSIPENIKNYFTLLKIKSFFSIFLFS
jgi:hypothetical protein